MTHYRMHRGAQQVVQGMDLVQLAAKIGEKRELRQALPFGRLQAIVTQHPGQLLADDTEDVGMFFR